jgi:hypothetical protein
MALKHGAEIPGEYLRWKMAKEYGWTLDYIDNLPLDDFHNWLQIIDGEAKARSR